jgi:hypothetical protein
MAWVALSPEETRALLASTRRIRRAAYCGVLGPIVFIVFLVILNRLTNGAMHVFVNGDPWTHYFWDAVFGAFMFGCFLLLVSLARRCPRCGEGLFVSKSYRRSTGNMSPKSGGVNVFARQCMNCALPLA